MLRIRTHLYDNLATLEEHLGQIETSLPYLKVLRTHVDEKATGIFLKKLQIAMETATRKAYSALVTRVLERKPRRKKESKEKKMIRYFGINKEEMWSMFRENKKAAFEHFGGDYDEAKFWTDAQCAVTQEVDTWAKKIGESRDPFEHANNVTSAAESEFPKLPIRGRKYPKEMFADFE